MKTDHLRNALAKEMEPSNQLGSQMDNNSLTNWKEGQCASL